jgi:isopropylmalate/homocitrate/citramalate synthase
LLNGFEDLKEEMILERRRAYEMLQNEAVEREKQRIRSKKQRERDQEIRDEKRIWSLKQREERELMKKILELEKECAVGGGGTSEQQRFEDEGDEDLQESKISKFDRVTLRKSFLGNEKTKISSPPAPPPPAREKETSKALERYCCFTPHLDHSSQTFHLSAL